MNHIIFPSARNKQIDFILSRLERLYSKSKIEKYSIEQNILFFKSARSVFKYFCWLYGLRKNIRGESLLEINELLSELDEVFHAKMAEIERRPRPGIIRPVVDYITELATNTPKDKRLRIASLGSGSMEVERQSVENIQNSRNTCKLTIVGFDISPSTRMFSEKNLSTLKSVRIIQETKLTEERLAVLERETRESVLIVISNNDIFSLSSNFTPNVFDLVITVLFLHHLHQTERVKLVKYMRVFAPMTLNYDGYKNETVIPLLSLTGWHSPVFLNAAVLSTVRFLSRTEVSHLHTGAKINFYYHGHYCATFSS